MGIGLDAVLNVAQTGVELLRYGAGLSVLRELIAGAVVGVVDAADWTDDSCRAAGAGFFEGGKLLLEDGAHFDFESQVFGDLLQTFCW